ncbi:uncharacterized protein LOC589127 [Strongylocentrotus purpuratus]|uniref:Uncharacterized protein n=1 Tax=Strongylocentrotus purpuratus TaxID=7668 RepID=A0A7M7PH01_STRPU|nr:uncharacterized protein LOC589127 [Strongylocentrotus purpuratus]|eukprot:XP_800543.1 PREDICTED: uncharacterized protein LOC589127 [Strongylocentrotus purpuratus]
MASMFRQKFLGFTGLVMIAYGIILAIQGNGAAIRFGHAAAAVPLWCGLLFVLIGCANLTQVFEKKKKQQREREDTLPFSFTVVFCNFTAVMVACLCIGFVSWGAWAAITTTGTLIILQQDAVETYTAIILANVFILFLALIAMFVDCCSGSLFGPSAPVERQMMQQPMYYDYQPRMVPALYKP